MQKLLALINERRTYHAYSHLAWRCEAIRQPARGVVQVSHVGATGVGDITAGYEQPRRGRVIPLMIINEDGGS